MLRTTRKSSDYVSHTYRSFHPNIHTSRRPYKLHVYIIIEISSPLVNIHSDRVKLKATHHKSHITTYISLYAKLSTPPRTEFSRKTTCCCPIAMRTHSTRKLQQRRGNFIATNSESEFHVRWNFSTDLRELVRACVCVCVTARRGITCAT